MPPACTIPTPTTDRAAQRLLLRTEHRAKYPPLPDPVTTDDSPTLPFSLPQSPPEPRVNLAVPYIHQLWDTPNNFDGHWACGPTSTAMLLAAYGLLPPHPIWTSRPTKHQNAYGWYVSAVFDHHGRRFDAMARTPTGEGRGLYGSIVFDGLAQASRNVSGTEKGILPTLRHFMTPIGNSVEFVPRPTRQDVVNSLDEGHPVILSGNVFGWGHILIIRGYAYEPTANSYHWLVNDPYGYRVRGGYDGENVAYRWQELYAPTGEPSKYLFRIRGSRRVGEAQAATD